MVGSGREQSGRAPSGSYGEVVRVAWPIVLSMISYTMMGLADVFMVAQVGTTEVAAVGLAVTATFTLTAFGGGILEGVKIVAAQSWGAGHVRRTREAAYQGVVMAALLGAAVMGLRPLARLVIGAMGGTGEVLELGEQYFELRLLGIIPLYISMAAFGYFQGLGDTKTPMRVAVLANAMNIGLDYLLIFGEGPIPALGVAGAAIATALSFGFQGAVGLALLVRAAPFDRRFRLTRWGEILRLGLPMGIRFSLDVFSWALFTGFVARVGEVHMAAHAIAIRITSVSFLPGYGIGEAACVLTGQAVGARRPEIARQVARKARNICLATMGACGVVFLFFGAELVSLFRAEPEVVETGSTLLLIAAAFQIFDGLAMVKTGALNGSGDTRYVMIVSVITAWAILVPLGYLLCIRAGWGAPGAWVALTIQIIVVAVFFAVRWKGQRPLRFALQRPIQSAAS